MFLYVGVCWIYIVYDLVCDWLLGYIVFNVNFMVDFGCYLLLFWVINFVKECYVIGQDGSMGFYNEFYGVLCQYGLCVCMEFQDGLLFI